MYNEIIDNMNKQGQNEESEVVFTKRNGKRRYRASKNPNNETIYISEVKADQLDEEFFDLGSVDYHSYDNIEDYPIYYLVDVVDKLFPRPKETLISFENERTKLDIFKTRPFQIDKYIKVDTQDNINGIVIDFETNQDFVEVCNEGVVVDMPNCRDYYNSIADIDDENETFDILESYNDREIQEEIEDLLCSSIEKFRAGAEVIPKGMYVIKDNKIYYLTAKEYSDFHYNDGYFDDMLYNLVEIPGFHQLVSGLIESKKQASYTLDGLMNYIDTLSNKKYFDLANLSDIGMSKEDFLSGLLFNNSKVVELLDKELKTSSEFSLK